MPTLYIDADPVGAQPTLSFGFDKDRLYGSSSNRTIKFRIV